MRWAILLAGALVVGSCNSDPGIQQVGGGGKAPTAPGGGGTGTGSGGGTAPGGGGTGSGGGGTGTGTGTGGGKTCSAVGAMAMPLPVDIYVLLDRSGSMLNDINDTGMQNIMPTPGVPVKWDQTVEALTRFVTSPAAEGLNVGLGLFPAKERSRNCNANNYATPTVPIAALPGAAAAFMTGVSTGAPGGGGGGGTPTYPALQGTIQYARQREAMMGRRVAIALATDGMPNTCPDNDALDNVVQVAQMGAGLGVYTFVIGVGKQLANLNQIAMAGGTKEAFLVENATADQLAMAFKAVQEKASQLVCSFQIPPPPAGMTLDPAKVNVRFNTPDPTMSFDIYQVPNAAACGPMGGWYYDNPTNPRTVNLCESSCMKVNGAGGGAIELLFGCAGVIIK